MHFKVMNSAYQIPTEGHQVPKYHTHHYWENDGEEGGLEDPEDSQTDYLDQGEQMDASQRNMTQEGEVWLVFGWHQV